MTRETPQTPLLWGNPFFSRATMRAPMQRIAITFRLDPDVLA
jgi:hypothetical protein